MRRQVGEGHGDSLARKRVAVERVFGSRRRSLGGKKTQRTSSLGVGQYCMGVPGVLEGPRGAFASLMTIPA